MNKNDARYNNTSNLLNTALIELLSKKNFEHITVKEVCDKAGVNRSTFYLHYESMDHLLYDTKKNCMNMFLSNYDLSIDNIFINFDRYSLEELNFMNKKYLTPYLEFIKNNKKMFNAFYINIGIMNIDKSLDYLNKFIIYPILSKYGVPEKDRKYWAAFAVTGVSAIVAIWLRNDCADDIDYIEEMIIECINPYRDKKGEKKYERDSK